jgi:hypothetical protein
VRSAPKEVLDLQVTRNTLGRALRLMNTPLKSLEPSGFTARVDEKKGQTLLVGCRTTLTISIIAQVARTNHAPTRAEVRARDRYYDSFERVPEESIRTSRGLIGTPPDGLRSPWDCGRHGSGTIRNAAS